MRVAWNVPLASLTTLELGGPAKRVVTAESEDEIADVVREVDARGEPLLVVGGGSNVVVGDEGFDGTVLRMASRGIAVTQASSERACVTVAAGEPWDDFVARAVGEGWAGVACLSGIPGLVGAVPMQNVGAYGQEVSETITSVTVLDRRSGNRCVIDRDACGFSYRNSVFRGQDRYVLITVSFAFRVARTSAPIRYGELARALAIDPADAGGRAREVPLATVRETVLSLRRAKGMVVDRADRDTCSAGSFFTNPILQSTAFAALSARVAPHLRPGETFPAFAEPNGGTKVSAAWLIERAGFAKGFGEGRVRVSTKHTLALTHRGQGTTAELVSLARTVQAGVFSAFGVKLEPEPVFVGVTL